MSHRDLHPVLLYSSRLLTGAKISGGGQRVKAAKPSRSCPVGRARGGGRGWTTLSVRRSPRRSRRSRQPGLEPGLQFTLVQLWMSDRSALTMVVIARIIRTANMAAGPSASTPNPSRSHITGCSARTQSLRGTLRPRTRVGVRCSWRRSPATQGSQRVAGCRASRSAPVAFQAMRSGHSRLQTRWASGSVTSLFRRIRGVAAWCQAWPGRPAGCKTMAGGGLMWPDVCRHWLPVWLP